MRIWGGLSFPQIALALGISANTARVNASVRSKVAYIARTVSSRP